MTIPVLVLLAITYSMISILRAQPPYEPVYVIVRPAAYILFRGMDYDQYEEEYFFQAVGETIAVACPIKDHPQNALKIVQKVKDEIVNYSLQCDDPVKSIVLRGINDTEFGIGYLIRKSRRDPRLKILYRDIPEDHYPVKLFNIRFLQQNSRLLCVAHFINFGKFTRIPAETVSLPNEIEYEKNTDIFGYDVDTLYDEKNQRERFTKKLSKIPICTLKKLQLAPEEDFVLYNYKIAARSNIITTPIWRCFSKKWYQLEEYTREVARILRILQIRTGTAHDKDTPADSLFYLHPDGDKLPVSKYLWKTIVFKQYIDRDVDQVGILFILHNELDKENWKPICEDISHEMGWRFIVDPVANNSMYACHLNHENMDKLGATLQGQYGEFNLHSVLTVQEDETGKTDLKYIDVYSKMRIARKEKYL